ncbi:hypothetical protein B6U66_05105 [Candidatus Bathyarchaeota archaeon ex4484_135]|nr:MAG: hypothetical protein B6U66_05105 [Candidatus Bathyarchaeota archaeon ex4484_135]
MLAHREHGTWRRRHRLEVIACILREAMNGATKTRLVYRANLNFKLLARYLEFLMSRSLIEVKKIGSMSYYQTTAKGRLWLTLYERMLDILGSR